MAAKRQLFHFGVFTTHKPGNFLILSPGIGESILVAITLSGNSLSHAAFYQWITHEIEASSLFDMSLLHG
jgi:hypothetical protein